MNQVNRVGAMVGLLAAGMTLLGAGLGIPPGNPPSAMPTPPLPTASDATRQPGNAERSYRLYCGSCHGGDRLMGLTADWIAQWPADDQNCWQSKCHSFNHPPDGFILPHDIPALAGPGALAGFRTAADLFAFIRGRMPYQEPGGLSDDLYWVIAAYILSRNEVMLPDSLGPENAAEVVIHPEKGSTPTVAPAPTATVEAGSAGPASRISPSVAAIAVVLGTAIGVGLFLRRRRTPPC